MASAADKQARYRDRRARHERGDHSTCIPGKCTEAPADPIPPPVKPTLIGLDNGMTVGGELLKKLRAERNFSVAEDELAKDIAEVTDRIEIVRAFLNGHPARWLQAAVDQLDPARTVNIRIDSVLSEVRALEALKAKLIAELRQHGLAAVRAGARSGGATDAPPASAPADPMGMGDVSDLFG